MSFNEVELMYYRVEYNQGFEEYVCTVENCDRYLFKDPFKSKRGLVQHIENEHPELLGLPNSPELLALPNSPEPIIEVQKNNQLDDQESFPQLPTRPDFSDLEMGSDSESYIHGNDLKNILESELKSDAENTTQSDTESEIEDDMESDDESDDESENRKNEPSIDEDLTFTSPTFPFAERNSQEALMATLSDLEKERKHELTYEEECILWLTRAQTQYGVPDAFIDLLLQNTDKLKTLENQSGPQIRKKSKNLYFSKSRAISLKTSKKTIHYNSVASIQQQIMETPGAEYYSTERFSKEDLKCELFQDYEEFLRNDPRNSLKILFADGFSKTRSRGGTMCSFFFLSQVYF